MLAQLGLPTLDAAAFRAAFTLPLARFFAALGVPSALLRRAETVWNRRLLVRPARLAPGACALFDIAGWAGVSVGVVRAAAAEFVEAHAARRGIVCRLAFIAGGVTSKRAELRRLARADGGPILYVGDTEYGVTAALAAGAVAVGVLWNYRPPEALRTAGATLVVDDLADIAALLSGSVGYGRRP